MAGNGRTRVNKVVVTVSSLGEILALDKANTTS